MSLLDDVSIVVTPNGYKAGELYAVVPVPVEGAEEGTNMDFSSGTSPWALNSNWSLGGVGVIADGTSNSTIWQSAVVEDNKQYIVTYTLTDFLQGSINVDLSGGNGITRTVAGTYTEAITAGTSPTTRLSFEGSGNFKVTLSNVIVKEYTSADMDVTRATAATRVDENGLVNYAEVIGGEEISCGDFECADPDAVWTRGTGWSISGGTANCIGGAGSLNLTQVALEIGKTYTVTYTVSNYSAGTIHPIMGGWTHGTYQSSNGTYTEVISNNHASANTTFYMQGKSGFVGSIDNISVKEVTRDNVPRIDYTGGGCPHILAEPMRTNLIPYSEEISQYNQSSSTASDNETISPDGTNNASKISKDGVNANDRVTTIITISNSTDYSLSAFIKNDDVANGGVSTIGARITGGTVFRQGYEWNGSTLSVTNSSQSGTRTNVLLEDYGNGWWKVGFSFTSDGTEARLEFDIDRVNGTDTTAIFLWGVQLEVGSYGTSYIPNFGTALGVTRNQDIFTRDGIGSLINSTEGVLFAEMAALADDGTYRYMGLTDGTDDNRVIILYYTSSTRIRVLISSGGTKYFDEYYGVTSILDFHKVAVKFKENDFALWIDGVERVTVTSGLTPIGLNTLALDQAGGSIMFAKVKQLQVYDTALTDEQLLQLTGESGTDFYESYAEMASALTYTIQ